VSAPAGRIGARVKRGDDPRLLTGRGRYVDDLTLPRMVHVAFVRSVHAHARLARVGVDAARRVPGVVGVLSGDAVARLCKPYRGILFHYKGMKTGAMLPLAAERVRYVGEPIVAIAAVSRAAADDAAALVDVQYESFAQAEITRLEELRLAAIEGRIEAELGLGHHDQVVGELEALVA